ncbi:UDP-N-acetylglucosamine pyrophosphorylase [Halenospora varia]|nr:UDP-N-acetylglucosamine pyrophosphorylase [Halenospora varia]
METVKNEGVPPKEPSSSKLEALKEKYTKAKQEQVFAFDNTLNVPEKASLYEQLSSFDPDHTNKITDKALNLPKTQDADKESGLEPLPESATASILDSKAKDIESVAVVLMAGGQGTQLGSSAPKGCFNIGLPSKKSLFQIRAERIRKVQRLAQKKAGLSAEKKAVVPWYVMTSGPTRGPIEQYFQENNYFGIEKENVLIFEQGVLPSSKGRVAVAPDGNGGIYQAIITSNVMEDMRKRGIQHIHAYFVRKRNSTESVGLILLKNGKPDVVEYSEIDKETAEAKYAKQPEVLKFRAANIAHELPHHVARKKIPYVDTKKGTMIKPEKPNGIKLEQFVFDVFPMLELKKFACMEVKRDDEFSPLKNAKGTGEDDPDTSKKDIMDQGKRWAQAAGAIVVSKGDVGGIEISLLISYGGEGLEKLKGKTITAPAVLE